MQRVISPTPSRLLLTFSSYPPPHPLSLILSCPLPLILSHLSPSFPAKEQHMQLKAEERRVAAAHLKEVTESLARLRAECERDKDMQMKWLVDENKRCESSKS
jgi:hypothetical protein